MYRTIEETARYLELPEDYVYSCIVSGKIRAVHDGEQFLVNADQFNLYWEQLEQYQQQIQQFLSEPVPADPVINDED
ncbi:MULTISPECIES: excisionase family DNA-binding protein [Salimicrobium]|uniref:DNA binding domain-containing protein, excisionase family n=1 Tax=Salimicrobium humidisoli TaxID=2029857 RepID=A0ABX4HPK4_9BACI|nr:MULTISPECIES: excisionase family DNA-binding protein [Salimicrobium]PBB05121.1 hypothetical protein CKW00_10590 [Salimicrobium humidisoli]